MPPEAEPLAAVSVDSTGSLNVFGKIDLDFYEGEFARQRIALQPHRPDAQRQPGLERAQVAEYLSGLPPRWVQELEAEAERLGPLPAGCRMVIAIPCRFEERRLGACLSAIQAAGADIRARSEVLVLDNHRWNETKDHTENVVSDHVANCPGGVPVRYAHRIVREHERGHGLSASRKFLADLSALRWLVSLHNTEPLYFASMDADVTRITPGTFGTALDLFDAKPAIDAVRGIQDRQRELMLRCPLLFLERRSWQFAERLFSARKYWPDRYPKADFTWHRNVTGGWNTFFSLAAYVAIRGYTELRMSEDLDIGNKISVLRGREGAHGVFRHDVRSIVSIGKRMDSSPNRFLASLLEEGDPYSEENDYEAFFGAESETTVRTSRAEELVERLNKSLSSRAALAERSDRVLSRTYRAMLGIDGENARHEMTRIMQVMGFPSQDFSFLGSSLHVRSYETFWGSLERRRTATDLH